VPGWRPPTWRWRPGSFWDWQKGSITKEQITRDLEFDSMEQKAREFVEKGAELYAKT